MNQKKEIRFIEKFIYGSGDIGLNAMYTLFSSYVLFFYTDVIGLKASLIGAVILASKIFDGFSDFIAGHWIDTHKRKRGHCIPVLMKWSIPYALSSVLVFLVPSTTSTVVRLLFIFVTYNLFNTIFFTLLAVAHNTLASYATSDPVSRSQMLCYKMLFAACIQMVMANVILPLVNFFGGQTQQSAWVKASLVFSLIGLFFLYLNVFFVKERVENDAPTENMLQSLRVAFKNKYWLMTVFIQICCSLQLMFSLSISVYYLKNVVGNLALMGTYVTLSNIPGIVCMIIMPSIISKVSKRNLMAAGTVIMIISQVVFCLSPSGNITVLMVTALTRAIGFSFIIGLVNAMTADTIEYGEWKTGVRIQGVLFSAKSVSEKLAQGILTSAFTFFLTAIGYNGLAEVQSSAAISGIDMFFKYVPIVVYLLLLVVLYFYKLDKEYPSILAELKARKGDPA